MLKKKRSQITNYSGLRALFRKHIFLFCKGELQIHVLNFIMDTSMTFNRLHVDLLTENFKTGHPNYQILGLPWKIREIRRARRALKESGLIFYEYIPNWSTKPVTHVINVTGMWNIIEGLYPLGDLVTEKLYEQAMTDMEKLGVDYDMFTAYQEDRFMKIEEAIKEGKEKSSIARSKKSKAIRLKENPTYADVVQLIREYCETYEIKWAGRLTQKDRTNMKRWAKTYSAQSNVAPTWWEHLELIIKHWRNMHADLRWPEGDKQIILPETFSWEWYFNRKGISVLIDGWLAVNKDMPKDRFQAFTDTVIDLTERRNAK